MILTMYNLQVIVFQEETFRLYVQFNLEEWYKAQKIFLKNNWAYKLRSFLVRVDSILPKEC